MDLGYIIGKDIVVGELFRLGGNKFLRGFDEESILVSNYQILNLEYRLLLDQYSFLSVFTDQGIMSQFTNLTDYTTIYTAGVGAGFTFQTKAGLFNLNYALGRTNNSSFSFRAAKIHFGYINIF
jgi:hemolysin activation/secretion protein